MAAPGRFALLALAVTGCACGSSPTAPRLPVCTPTQSVLPLRLNPGEMFRVHFVGAAPTPVDVLLSFLGETVHGWTDGGATVQKLFDGDRLLGSSSIDDGAVIWSAPESLINTPASRLGFGGSSTTIDFSTIRNGSIRGRLEFAVVSGRFTISRPDLATFAATSSVEYREWDWTVMTVLSREVCR